MHGFNCGARETREGDDGMTDSGTSAKKAWSSMALTYVGNVADVVRMPGNGKSGSGADPGDFLKPRGQDN